MTPPARTDLVHAAICAGFLGHFQWNDAAARRVRADRDLLGIVPEEIRALLRQFVMTGKALDARAETRREYLDPDHPRWHRAVIPVQGMAHGLFVEVRLIDDDPNGPWVEIVNAHPQLR